jgi:hypothetical protein
MTPLNRAGTADAPTILSFGIHEVNLDARKIDVASSGRQNARVSIIAARSK